MACFVKQGLPYNKPGEELTQLRRYNLVSVTGMQYLKRFVTTGIRCVVLIQSMCQAHVTVTMFVVPHMMCVCVCVFAGQEATYSTPQLGLLAC